jgi:putative tryptophan/tyrosine transport system substrate-binding protein
VRRRDFTIALMIAGAAQSVCAQEPAKQHRIAIVVPAGPVARVDASGARFWQTFFEELRRLGDVEGQNLTIDRYSGEGRPEHYADLARDVIDRNPDVIVASSDAVAQSARAANGTIPIVWIGGDPVSAGLATSLAHPGSNITGVTVDAGIEIWGKRLQILKEAVPSASKVAFLAMHGQWEGPYGHQLREAGRGLKISLIGMPLQESTPSEYQRAFAEIVGKQPDAIIVSSRASLSAYSQQIVELVERGRLPAMYPSRDYVDVGGLMAYEGDIGELGRRMADDVHQILNGAKPGDIPIYRPSKFALVINLKTADALGLTLPPAILARADEVIE